MARQRLTDDEWQLRGHRNKRRAPAPERPPPAEDSTPSRPPTDDELLRMAQLDPVECGAYKREHGIACPLGRLHAWFMANEAAVLKAWFRRGLHGLRPSLWWHVHALVGVHRYAGETQLQALARYELLTDRERAMMEQHRRFNQRAYEKEPE